MRYKLCLLYFFQVRATRDKNVRNALNTYFLHRYVRINGSKRTRGPAFRSGPFFEFFWHQLPFFDTFGPFVFGVFVATRDKNVHNVSCAWGREQYLGEQKRNPVCASP